MEEKPWVNGSLEVLELSIEQYYMSQQIEKRRSSERYLRLALINADDAAELSMKAFVHYYMNRKAPESFPALVDFLRKEGGKVGVLLPKKVEDKLRFYHNQRNNLYHEGYILSVARSYVFDYISCVRNLFSILFKSDIETSFQYDVRQQYVFMYIDLERILRDICVECRVNFDDFVGIQPILELLKKTGIAISNDLGFNIEKVIDLHNTLVPQTVGIQEDQDIDESLTVLSETIESLAASLDELRKRKRIGK